MYPCRGSSSQPEAARDDPAEDLARPSPDREGGCRQYGGGQCCSIWVARIELRNIVDEPSCRFGNLAFKRGPEIFDERTLHIDLLAGLEMFGDRRGHGPQCREVRDEPADRGLIRGGTVGADPI